MTDWIRRGERVYVVTFHRNFDYEGEVGWGYGFDCDEQGNVKNLDNPDAVANYEACLTGVDRDGRRVVDRGIQRYENSYWEPGVIRCDSCGAEVVLDMNMTNTCDRCGTDYNASGQRLAPREQWGEETGETASDILMADRPIR